MWVCEALNILASEKTHLTHIASLLPIYWTLSINTQYTNTLSSSKYYSLVNITHYKGESHLSFHFDSKVGNSSSFKVKTHECTENAFG